MMMGDERPVVCGPRAPGFRGGWFCDATVDGHRYQVGVFVVDHGGVPGYYGFVSRGGFTLFEQPIHPEVEPHTLLQLAGVLP